MYKYLTTIFIILFAVLVNPQDIEAAVNPNSIPEILYAGDLLTISATKETKPESKR